MLQLLVLLQCNVPKHFTAVKVLVCHHLSCIIFHNHMMLSLFLCIGVRPLWCEHTIFAVPVNIYTDYREPLHLGWIELFLKIVEECLGATLSCQTSYYQSPKRYILKPKDFWHHDYDSMLMTFQINLGRLIIFCRDMFSAFDFSDCSTTEQPLNKLKPKGCLILLL